MLCGFIHADNGIGVGECYTVYNELHSCVLGLYTFEKSLEIFDTPCTNKSDIGCHSTGNLLNTLYYCYIVI